MKIQTRLIALLAVLLAVFSGSLALLRQAHERETQRMLGEIGKERGELLDRLLDLTGLSLKSFASDYSLWSEMADFVRSGDPQWAEVNIEASLPNFNVHGAWVLRPDGSQVYGAVRELDDAARELPLPATFLAELQRQKFLHFFHRTPAGILEFRAAPVQPSADVARTSAPLGWLLVARLWDQDYRERLRGVLEGEIELQPEPRRAPEGALLLQRELKEWDGQRAAVLHVFYRAEALHLLDRENYFEAALFIGFGLLMLLLTVAGVSRWVVKPMRQLEESLATNSPAPLHRLRHERDEFGRLATLVETSFEHRRQLEAEVEERRRVEEALRRSEEDLRSASELKTRLARDLHDGVIQSIYAAGLGLEGIRALLRSAPDTADQRLVAAQTSLNQTIREVRSFIQGLEPEETERPDFAHALRSLVSTLQTLHAVDLKLRLPATPPRLNPREEVHSLQIVRECVSNALRHGAARAIHVTFEYRDGSATLEIRDDGKGFDPALARSRGGSGLANLESRAAEIGAKLDIQSSPGKGTAITLRFKPTSPPA